MAVSRKLKTNNLKSHTQTVLARYLRSGQKVCVALSGGMDSVVLLDILSRLRDTLQIGLSAVHVNHQLSPNALEWELFCREFCFSRDVSLTVAQVLVENNGSGIEASARRARYDIFRHLDADFIALGHHLDDQAETLLLQLLRGAGVSGLSAMPALRQIPGEPALLRPLLDMPREVIRTYAENLALKWVHDESNDNTDFDRNYLRHKVLPLISVRFSAYRETFSRASRHLSETRVLLEDLAKMDAQEAVVDGQLDLAVLALMRRARQKNLLRYFLNLHSFGAPSSANLDDMLDQLLNARSDSQVLIQLSVGQIRCYRGYARVLRDVLEPVGWQAVWSGETELSLPSIGSVLIAKEVLGNGISREKLLSGIVQIRSRHGGERLQPDCKRPNRSLKNLLQEAEIPPWERAVLPLIYLNDVLVMVPGIGINCDFQAVPGEQGIVFELVRKS